MRQIRSILTLALAKTMADNLVLSEDARDLTAQSAAVTLLKELCAAALDPGLPDGQALSRVRALCLQAQLYCREQGL